MHIIAGKAVCFQEALQPEFKEYAKQIIANAQALAETLMAGGIKLASGGTENHLMLADVTAIGLSGKIAEEALDRAGITVNKNMIPFDPLPPRITSGIRLGSPAVTTRGFGPDEMKLIGESILQAVFNINDEAMLQEVKQVTAQLCARLPVPGLE